MLRISDIPIKNKHVLIRADFNVPLLINDSKPPKITHDGRLKASLPTIQWALSQGAKIILLSHLGRPQEGVYQENFSLKPVAERLSQLLNYNVRLEQNWLGKNKETLDIKSDEIILCENVRFNIGEKSNDERLAKKMAQLGDIFVMDAFATAHRKEASTYGIAQFVPMACAGFLLIKELEALSKAFKNPTRPLLAIVGGSKVSTKLSALEKLLEKVNSLILGGGIANTFLAAQGYSIGKSLYEPDWVNQARLLIKKAEETHIKLYLPKDVMLAKAFSAESPARLADVNDIQSDEMILDVGPKTSLSYEKPIQQAATIIWNGPLGVFEFPTFSKGTQNLAENISRSKAFSLAGGGDTLSAIEQFKISDKISYMSTGGGAFLEFIEGKTLPAVEILNRF